MSTIKTDITFSDQNMGGSSGVSSVNSRTGAVSLTANDVGLGSVTNESKATMFTSPTFTGSPILATPASGNFSTGTFTWPTFNQNTTGTSAKATILETARNINGVSFNGSADITVTADANTLSNTTLKSTVVNSSLTSVGTLTSLTVSGQSTQPKIFFNRESNATSGLQWYNNATYNAWCDYMSNPVANVGPRGTITAPSGTLVTSWAKRSYIENNAGYGWTFESGAYTSTTPSVVCEIQSSDGAIRSGGNISGTTLTSRVATGTAPLTVTSTTAVTNLNADLLDGQHGAYYAPIASPTFTGTVSGITAAMVGLGNVTNESKATMFTSPTFTGTVSGVTAAMVGLGNVANESKATMFTSPTFTGSPSITGGSLTMNAGANTTSIIQTPVSQELKFLFGTKNFPGYGQASMNLSVQGGGYARIDFGTPGMYMYEGYGSSFHMGYSGISFVNAGGNGGTGKFTISSSPGIDIVGNTAFTGTVTGITSSMVGLGNVDNTSDVNKPVSTAQATAIGLKENSSNKTTTANFFSNANSDVLFPTNKAVTDQLATKADNTTLATKAPISNPVFTGTATGNFSGKFTGSDVSNLLNDNPALLSSQAISGGGDFVGNCCAGHYVYVTGVHGIKVYDVTVQTNPVLVSSNSTFSYKGTPQYKGGYVYDLRDGGGFYKIDVTNPASVSMTYLGVMGVLFSIVGKYAYISDYYVLKVFDLSTNSVVGTANCGTEGVSLVVNGNYVYVLGLWGVQVVDVSNPTSPFVVNSYSDPNYIYAARSMKVSGKYLFIISWPGNISGNAYLSIFDISNPLSITVVSKTSISNIWKIGIYGVYMYALCQSNDGSSGMMKVYNISSPSSLNYITQLTGLNNPYSIVILGAYAYISSATYGGFGAQSLFMSVLIGGLKTTSADINNLYSSEINCEELTVSEKATFGYGISVGRGIICNGDIGATQSISAQTNISSGGNVSLSGQVVIGSDVNIYRSAANVLKTDDSLVVSSDFACYGNETTIRLNAQAITSNFTIPATSNGLTAGPITINSGVTVTISSGGVWTIV